MIRFKNDAAEVRYDFCAWNDVDDRVEFYYDDEIVAGCMLHDVVEDCGKKIEELPVGDEAKEIVRLVSHGKTTPENRDRIMKEYYDGIASNPKAALHRFGGGALDLAKMFRISSKQIHI